MDEHFAFYLVQLCQLILFYEASRAETSNLHLVREKMSFSTVIRDLVKEAYDIRKRGETIEQRLQTAIMDFEKEEIWNK